MTRRAICRHPCRLALVAGLTFAGLPTAGAQEAGDPVAGLGLARELCTACHRIDPGAGAGPRTGAPNFTAIAAIPSLSGIGLKVFLRTPHGEMPRYQFTDKQLDDVVAYIRSLAGK